MNKVISDLKDGKFTSKIEAGNNVVVNTHVTSDNDCIQISFGVSGEIVHINSVRIKNTFTIWRIKRALENGAMNKKPQTNGDLIKGAK